MKFYEVILEVKLLLGDASRGDAFGLISNLNYFLRRSPF